MFVLTFLSFSQADEHNTFPNTNNPQLFTVSLLKEGNQFNGDLKQNMKNVVYYMYSGMYIYFFYTNLPL